MLAEVFPNPGQITLLVKLSAEGRPTDVGVTRSTLGMKNVENCIVEMVRGWELTPPGAPAEFSFTYEFQAD